MPGFDGTGPQGQGPRTGRGAGNCAGAQGFGFGFGRGRGMMRRGRFGFSCPWFRTNADDAASLDELEKALEEELAAVRKEKKARKKE